MKYGFLFSIVLFSIFMIYGAGFMKKSMPDEEQLQEYIDTLEKYSKTDISQENLSHEDLEKLMEIKQNIIPDTIDDEEYNPMDYVELHAPVMEKLLKIFEKKEESITLDSIGDKIYINYLKFSKLNMKYGKLYLLLGVLIVALSFTLNVSGLYSITSLLCRIGFFTGRMGLIVSSCTAVVFWLLIKRSLWVDSGINSFLGPEAILIGSCLALKSFDPNFPIWNRLLSSTFLPLLSIIIITFMQ